MTDIEHRNAALSVVRELGSTVVKQLLINIVHDIYKLQVKANI